MGMENWNDEGVKQIVESDIDSNGNEVVDVICEQPENFVFLKKHKCASSTFQESGQTIRLYDLYRKSYTVHAIWNIWFDILCVI